MSNRIFTGLHNHTMFSLKDSISRPDDICRKVKELGMDTIAITDHGTLAGWLMMQEAGKKHGVKIIYGMEAYFVDDVGAIKRINSDHDELKSTIKALEIAIKNGKADNNKKKMDRLKEKSQEFDNIKKTLRRYNHLILLAKNWNGCMALIRMHNRAVIDGMYYKPRLDWKVLEEEVTQGDIVATSACLGGRIAKCIQYGEPQDAVDAINRYNKIFGKGNFYLELQLNHEDLQKNLNIELVKLSESTGTPTVVTCFPSGTLIETVNGQTAIEDIKVGTKVRSHDGKYHKVLKTFKNKAKSLVKIVPSHGTDSLTCTPNHPVLVARAQRYMPSGTLKQKFDDPKWIPACDIKEGDALVYPKTVTGDGISTIKLRDYVYPLETKNRRIEDGFLRTFANGSVSVPLNVSLSEDFLFILGIYIADGCRDKQGAKVSFTLHEKENYLIDRVKNYFSEFGITVSALKQKGASYSVQFSSIVFAELFSTLVGDHCENKKFPDFWRNLNDKQLSTLVDGYTSGDGCSSYGMTISTVSKKLAYDFSEAITQLGAFAKVTKRNGDRIVARHGKPSKEKAQYMVSLSDKHLKLLELTKNKAKDSLKVVKPQSRSKHFEDGNFFYSRVKYITTSDVDEIDVFNFEVEDSNSYIANGWVCHNCDSHYIEAGAHETRALFRRLDTEGDSAYNDTEMVDLYIKNEEHLFSAWHQYMDGLEPIHLARAIKNTRAIADSIQKFPFDTSLKFPTFNTTDDATQEDFLTKVAVKGLMAKGLHKDQRYVDRLRRELKTINKLGFASYFNIVGDLVGTARLDQPVGPGRGSAAGSIVAFCVGITNVDPIRHELVFERFLDESKGLMMPTFGLEIAEISLDYDAILEACKCHKND